MRNQPQNPLSAKTPLQNCGETSGRPYRILIHKLTFLAKLLSNTDDKISSRIFSSLAILDVYNVGLVVQQCRTLEAEVSTNVLAQCLKNPTDAPAIVKSMKQEILKSDIEALLSSTATHHSARYVAEVAKTTSWMGLSSGPGCSGNTWPPDFVENTQPTETHHVLPVGSIYRQTHYGSIT